MRWDLSATNLSQKELARLLKVEKSHFSRFLSGKVGLSAETTLKLLQLMNLSPRSLALKFGQPEVTRARLMHLQESGREMKLSNDGGGWVSKEGDSAADPNNRGDDITNTWKANGAPSDDELIDVLRQVDNIHKQAREAIANWFANNQKAKPEGPRKISDNTTSKSPGPRADLFDRNAELLRGTIQRMRASRQAEEEKLQLEKELAAEAKAWFDAKQQLMSLQKR